MKQTIIDIINETIRKSNCRTRFREPLTGCAPADDPQFSRLREAAHPNHLLPEEMLPGARSVFAFFLPFDSRLVEKNRKHPYVSREWAEAYVETNQLIKDICKEIYRYLADMGFNAAYEQPTHNFDSELLLSNWSHKHIAYVCGLGSFGRNTMLITGGGCAGRFGSLVTDAYLEPSAQTRPLYHPFCERCDYCARICPVSALRDGSFDKAACYRRLLEVNDFFSDLPLTDVCGKCACGPCALRDPAPNTSETVGA